MGPDEHRRCLSPALLRAYRSTCYRVEGIEVRIGRRSPGMDEVLRSHAVLQAGFVTAYNPYSRPMPAGWNQRMQARLGQAVRRYQVLSGSGSWRRWSEAHLLVFGDARLVRHVGRRFRQRAIVVARRGQPVRLVIVSCSA
ncbi:MAG TPA: DUF3293 domain-containing protein [Rhodopila sp.]